MAMRFFLFLGVCLPLAAQPGMNLTLAQAEQVAIQHNPQFSAAKNTAAAAYQAPEQYRAGMRPTLYGSVTGAGADNGSRLAAGGLNNPVVYDRIGTGLSASQLITDFGRTSDLVGTATLRAQAQDQFTEATRADILLATGNAYFGLLKAQALLKVAEQTVKARQTVADRVSALAQSKLRSTFDVSVANVNLSDAKLLLVQTQNGVKAAQSRLANALGLPGETAFTLTEEALPGELPDRVDDLISAAIQNRPELKDLRLQQSAAERFSKAEHGLNLPSVNVMGSAGFAPAGAVQVPRRYGAIGMNLNIPIFNGGLFHARQAEAEFKAKAASDNVGVLQNRVIRDVRVTYLDAMTAHDRMALTAEMLKQAQLGMDLAQDRFDLGLGAIVELSQAQLNLTSAEIAQASARYDYQALRIALDYQTGVLH
jgi:outer membrane protein